MDDAYMAMCDCTSAWFVEHCTSPKAMDWRKNRTFPVIYKLKDNMQLDSIIKVERYKTITKIDGKVIAVCFGPMHAFELLEYGNHYERIT